MRALFERKRAYVHIATATITPQGDEHPMLVIPGFLGTDHATALLRKYLIKLGYNALPWELGLNLGNIKKVQLLLDEIERIHETYQSKVTLVGWSLGGVYARQLAKEKPELIEQVIMLGAPFKGMDKPNNAAWLFRLINGDRAIPEEDKKWMIDIPSPPPVPTLSIYSKEDGIVPWQARLESSPNTKHQNAEIQGSHQGMPFNVQAWQIIATYLKGGIKQ